jgi:DNA recombination protein RmuC
VFASPNTLMAMLRVADRLWTRDKLQKQAMKISETGGHLLDSVIAFLADFTSVGAELENAQKAYRAARNRLEESPQAVIPRARRLAELGVKGKKKLPADLEPEGPRRRSPQPPSIGVTGIASSGTVGLFSSRRYSGSVLSSSRLRSPKIW